jgi:hypothetical protein
MSMTTVYSEPSAAQYEPLDRIVNRQKDELSG